MTSDVRFGQYPAPGRVIVHLSDPHLLADGRRLYDAVDVQANLEQALRQIERMELRPDAMVFTGDLADLGEADAYRRLRERVEPVAERLGTTIVWLMGNHDERSVMRTELLDLPAGEQPLDAVWDFGGLRVIGLDSTVPGWHHGELEDSQLEWLQTVLAAPAPLGSILAMHHPPVPSSIPFFDILELRDQHRLEAVLRGSDVRAILGGHLHYSTSSTFAGIPVQVASASCYSMNLSLPSVEVNGMFGGQSFNLVHVYDDRITHSTVPLGDYTTAGTFSAAFVDRMAALSPAERLEAFSRKR
ncbi:phosphodiesterase [Plantibacter sp. H53]|uniref:phosphodiesterase n=1 Tax=unclassified Plantibacter TaxID=2624265 RepID=UPI0007D9D4F4|nr:MULTISPECIES: phosphodiesterase [unclassified Plantibacter]OAN34900.1 phosphodiesterase [Plantibacter sp. H53]OII36345.1 phosphodiesterase [Plantibacter sp. MMLR14_011]